MKAVKRQEKPPKKPKIEMIDLAELKETIEYKQGFKDAGILLKLGLSMWLVSNYGGMGRKHPQQSHKKLYAYCEGFQNRVKKAAKDKGIKIPIHSAFGLAIFSQDDIGK